MATQLTNTFDTYDAVGNREDLSNLIDLITPEETPLYSSIGTEKASATKTEWQTDTNATPSTSNAHVQGEVYEFDPVTATSRVGNFTQIFMKTALISETQEAVDKAGRASEVKRTKLKLGVEGKTDMEVTMLSNQASVAGSASIPAVMGGMRAWLASNDSMGSGGASGGYNGTTGLVTAATNGSQRAFSKTLLDGCIEAVHNSGGSPKVIMGSPYVKRVFSTIMSDSNVAQLRTNVDGAAATLVGAVDAYLSDFGLMTFVVNRQMARAGAAVARNVYVLDVPKIKKAVLRPWQQDTKVAKTGDGIPIVMKGELTLKVINEAASGVVADVYGMSAAA